MGGASKNKKIRYRVDTEGEYGQMEAPGNPDIFIFSRLASGPLCFDPQKLGLIGHYDLACQ